MPKVGPSQDTCRTRASARPQNCGKPKPFPRHRKNSMMRTLKSIVAVVAIAVIVGQVGTGQRAGITPKDRGLQLSSNSAPAQILLKACGNCHSNHTDWPWYSHVAPVSWWIARDISEGREKLDFSQWETYSPRQKRDTLESMCGLISTGRMPPRLYTAMHPEAKLSEKDKQAVCAWVKKQTNVQR
jgi:Haem-binding domain